MILLRHYLIWSLRNLCQDPAQGLYYYCCLKDSVKEKFLLLSGIDRATFQLVAQFHNNLRLLIYSTEQSFLRCRFSASQEIPRILWNPKAHYRIHKCPPPVPILSHINPVHAPHPTSWRSSLILSSHLRQGLPSGLFPQYPVNTSPIPHTCYMPRSSHSYRFHHPDYIYINKNNNNAL